MAGIYYSDDPVRDADRYLADREEEEQRYISMCPECCRCKDKITEDAFFKINGDHYCEDCMREEFSFSVDLYVEQMKRREM